MRTTGQILKENRERKGITLNEVSLATKISVKVLQAIEEGDAEKLPTKTFLRGFVRAYARYLNLDEDAILNSFYEEMGSTKPKTNISPDAQRVTGEAQVSNKAAAGRSLDDSSGDWVKKTGVVGAILILVVAIVLLKNKADSYRNETVLGDPPKDISAISPTPLPDGMIDPTATPAEVTPAETTATTSEVIPPPLPETTAPAVVAIDLTATLTATPTATPSATASPSPNATPTPSAMPSPSPTPKPSPNPTPSATPNATPEPSPTPGGTPAPSPTPTLPKANKEVIIETMNDVEVDVQIDNEPMRKMTLKADSVQAFKMSRKVILRFSDGGAVNLIVNGKDRGVPGDLGKPVKIELP